MTTYRKRLHIFGVTCLIELWHFDNESFRVSIVDLMVQIYESRGAKITAHIFFARKRPAKLLEFVTCDVLAYQCRVEDITFKS